MQPEPEKTYSNYNEINEIPAFDPFKDGPIPIYTDNENDIEVAKHIVQQGLSLAEAKITEILGPNLITGDHVTHPRVHFVSEDKERPNILGYYRAYENLIVVITRNDSPVEQMKTFIHEYLHFLSHNGRDDDEKVSIYSPLAKHNNVGFRRNFGIDIRENAEKEITNNYFIAFNEAVTEQLAIDILPNTYESYHDYRGLLNGVIDDAIMRGLGSKDRDGLFTQWTKNEFKNYIYQCYFKGDLNAFTNLLHTIYEEFDISEQMFGLMTNINDLPSSVHYKMIKENGTRPSYKQVKEQIVKQLNIKTPEDYITDVDPPKDGPKNDGGDSQAVHKAAYVRYIDENDITYATTESVNGTEFEIDTLGYIIYTGDAAASLLDSIKTELDTLVNNGLSADEIITHIDELLFEQYCISMLSDGFEEFYVYKHALLDTLS